MAKRSFKIWSMCVNFTIWIFYGPYYGLHSSDTLRSNLRITRFSNAIHSVFLSSKYISTLWTDFLSLILSFYLYLRNIFAPFKHQNNYIFTIILFTTSAAHLENKATRPVKLRLNDCRTFCNFVRQIHNSATHQSEKSIFSNDDNQQLSKSNKYLATE